MPLLECSYCGCADFKAFLIRDNGYVCKCCGRYTYEERSLGEDDVRRLSRCDGGYAELRGYRFGEAQKIFEDIICDFPNCVEARWGLLQAKYGVVYVKGFYTGQVTPIYCFPDYDHENIEYFTDNPEYKNFIRLLEKDSDMRRLYERKAAEIDDALDLFADSIEDSPLDVFICVKISNSLPSRPDDTSKAEPDFTKAKELQKKLTAMGKKVFFSYESLTNNPNSDMEIWSSLVRSKKMILITSSRDYVESVWVRSEWERWLNLGDKHKKNLYIYLLGNATHLSRRLPQLLRGGQFYSEDREDKLIEDVCFDEEEEARRKLLEEERKAEEARRAEEARKAEEANQKHNLELMKILSGLQSSLDGIKKENEALDRLASDRDAEKKQLTDKLESAEKERDEAQAASAEKDGLIASLRKELNEALEKCLSYASKISALDYENRRIFEKLCQSEAREKELSARLAQADSPVDGLTAEKEKLAASLSDASEAEELKKESAESKYVKAGKDTAAERKADLQTLQTAPPLTAGRLVYRDGSTELFHENGRSIADKAYVGKDIVKAFLPEGVEIIGKQAFMNCEYMTEIVIPDSVHTIADSAFCGCKALKSFRIPPKVTQLSYSLLSGCSSLTSVNIPEDVEKIDAWVFKGCSSLVSLNAAEGNPVYYSQGNCIIDKKQKMLVAGCKTSVIPEDGSVTVIGTGAFAMQSELASVTLPEAVNKINSSAFSGCVKLTEISLPAGISVIGGKAFHGCRSLKTVNIPEGVKTVAKSAFDGCPLLTVHYAGTKKEWQAFGVKAEIPTVCAKSSDGTAFYLGGRTENVSFKKTFVDLREYRKKTDLVKLILPNSVKELKGGFLKGPFEGCTSLTEIFLPEGIAEIPDFAFFGCSSLVKVNIPSTVKSIGIHAFSGCASLSNVMIPDGVTEIWSFAFKSCAKLGCIEIPKSVKHLETSAFDNISNLTVLYKGTREQWEKLYKGGNVHVIFK